MKLPFILFISFSNSGRFGFANLVEQKEHLERQPSEIWILYALELLNFGRFNFDSFLKDKSSICLFNIFGISVIWEVLIKEASGANFFRILYSALGMQPVIINFLSGYFFNRFFIKPWILLSVFCLTAQLLIIIISACSILVSL